MTSASSGSPAPQTAAGGVTAHEQASGIADLVFAIAYRSQVHFEATAAEFGLAPQQARALLSLDEPAPMHALASDMACDASNITGIADRLEDRGLIERQPGEQDRRVKLLVLTPAGDHLRSELAAQLGETAPVMTQLSESERETLYTLLLKIAGDAPGGGC
jgi:DNA-binding MarR family transcriptional regulator